ncbi:putative mitochondrial iron/zinc transporter protein-like protein [Leptomonas pyrrhocoris]|uniref:Putative mitochondrial iron/zinc transporter protein-like protein n=1 Tax=Leptomonas pyrrhocoris TaxID=157538 RepID=A0A0N1J4A0_LEPPY|nr:putative mitochondrial iron/zinc transporter protein-like protein [Leptomonas pyrrhocoris]KPA74602.1 putative mitochondrial iron/zinc transporter protein-like protein [Leptomonas pyrrhocoris]|eukprot:XP_015653041.1 putative mitochondrial iron/zinc transporter protein-like protein [Leptomonas pyrrhocoris]
MPFGSIRRAAVSALAAEGEGKHSLCDGLTGSYSVGLHVFAIFLILFISMLGTAMPIMTKYIALFRENPFAFTVGKTAATGVLLSVSTIHLIHEGAEAFREECVYAFFKDYEPFYFLFALIAVLVMQAIDLQLAAVAERWLKKNHQQNAASSEVVIVSDFPEDSAAAAGVPDAAGADRRALANECDAASQASPTSPGVQKSAVDDQRARRNSSGSERDKTTVGLSDAAAVSALGNDHHSDLHAHADGECEAHGHQHLVVTVPMDMGSIRRVIAAVCMEFGVTLHSVFVGLAIGLTTDTELKPLLFALVFHQLFEGMAMGSRLVDAKFEGNLETYLALVFSVSAPAGMAAATIAVSVSRDAMTGSGFVTMMAILDSLCGGILLYLAFTLLLGDFVADMKLFCADDLPGRRSRKIILFAALWFGMGLMAFVGKWL